MADAEARADAECTAAAEVTVMRQLMDDELHNANNEVIRLTAKSEQDKLELNAKLERATKAFDAREKRFQKELSYESKVSEKFREQAAAAKSETRQYEFNAMKTVDAESELRLEYNNLLEDQ